MEKEDLKKIILSEIETEFQSVTDLKFKPTVDKNKIVVEFIHCGTDCIKENFETDNFIFLYVDSNEIDDFSKFQKYLVCKKVTTITTNYKHTKEF